MTVLRRLCGRIGARGSIPSWLVVRDCSQQASTSRAVNTNLDAFPPEKIRNFCVIAHVDHGKSTLADRLMELTGLVEPGGEQQQLDKLQVERERGITVKAQTCSLVHRGHLLNLIDTPGHADFSFEVARSLAACDGAVLLVAANQGVRAQTVANFWLAFERDLVLVPVINKVDLNNGANVPNVLSQLKTLFEFDAEDCLQISAKSGLNVMAVLDAVVDRMPPPRRADRSSPFRAMIFDSWYIDWRGAIACVLVTEGAIEKGSKIRSYHGDMAYEVAEVGLMRPNMTPCSRLSAGQVGYVVACMKTVREAAVGETLYLNDGSSTKENVMPYHALSPAKPTVFSGLYPVDPKDYEQLRLALERLCLNDPAVTVDTAISPALGFGWRIGYLGILHMEVFGQRLEQEYDASVIITAPSVEYKASIVDVESVRQRRFDGQSQVTIVHPSQYPQFPHTDVEAFWEPMVKATIIFPSEYTGAVSSLCNSRRGCHQSSSMIDNNCLLVVYTLPLAEVVVDFFARLKGLTSGYASFDYELDGYQQTDLVKLSVTVNGRPIDEFSLITPSLMAKERGRSIVARLKKDIPQQQYEVEIKAFTGVKTQVASAKIHAMGKDISQKLKGKMDAGRMQKKVLHQQRGKKKMREVGNVMIPKETFANVLKI